MSVNQCCNLILDLSCQTQLLGRSPLLFLQHGFSVNPCFIWHSLSQVAEPRVAVGSMLS